MRITPAVPTRVPVAGRSLHRWLVALPIVALVVTVIGFAGHVGDGGADWLRVGFIANLALLIAALAAGVPGLLDYLAVPPGHPARRVGAIHLGLNTVALTLAAVNVVMHPRQVTAVLEGRRFALEGFDSTGSMWLIAIAFALLGASGTIGRLLATRYRVGEVEPTSSSSGTMPTRPRTV